MDFNRYRQNSYSRDELIRSIENIIRKLNDKELEALYYDIITKDYVKD
jgi:hypothetical protein